MWTIRQTDDIKTWLDGLNLGKKIQVSTAKQYLVEVFYNKEFGIFETYKTTFNQMFQLKSTNFNIILLTIVFA